MKRTLSVRKVRRALATGFALSMFVLPPLLTGWWFVFAAHPHDSRQLQPVVTFQGRQIDEVVAPLKPFQEPLVSITFDDGWESVYTAGFPILQRSGFHSTQYIITSTLSYPGYMSVEQLRAMQHAGTEIASHTVSHADLTTLTGQELTHELADSQKTLQHDFGVSVRDFTSPYGGFDTYTLGMIGHYYRSQKNAEGTVNDATDLSSSINLRETFDPLNIISLSVRKDTTLTDLQQLLSDTEQHNGWLVLTYHQIDTGGDTFSVTPQAFQAQMRLIRNSPIRSATVGQVLDSLGDK